MRAAPDEQWHDTEEALRRLLRDGMPQPATPVDRMTRIVWRVRRRRRRRATALGAAAAVACAGLVPVLWSPGAAEPPSAARERQQVLSAAPPTPSLGSSRDLMVVRLLNATDLTLRVPGGWHAMTVGQGAAATAFVASQPLSRPSADSCPESADGGLPLCEPLKELAEGGVLMAFRLSTMAKADAATPLRMGPSAPAGKSCRVLRGDTEIAAWGHGRAAVSGKPFGVRVSLCLRAPSDAALATAADVLADGFPRTGG